MFTISRIKKKHCRLMANRRGFSSIVGAIFAVLVIFSLASSVFVWTLSQNTRYNNAVTAKNQLIADQQNENIKAYDVTYAVAGNVVSVAASLKNEGPLSSQIITLWVADATTNTNGFVSLNNIILKPGDIISPSPINVQIGGSPLSSDKFTCRFITSRGNSIAGEPPKVINIVTAEVAQGIGAIALNFNDFKFFNVTLTGGNYYMSPYPSGASGYSVYQPPKTTGGVAFGVSLTNFDKDGRTITLKSGSVLFSLFPTTPQQVRGAPWYIANVDSSGKVSNSYTPIQIGYLQTVRIYFASFNEIKGSDTFVPTVSGFTGTAPVNLALIGTIGANNDFGQNIPFVSIYFHS